MTPNQLYFEGMRVTEQRIPQSTVTSTNVDIGSATDRVAIPRICFVMLQ